MEERNATPSAEIADSDIIFECPHCAKSMAIDQRGAGLMITCPDCATRIQVPESTSIDEEESAEARTEAVSDRQSRNLAEALKASRAKVSQLMEGMEEMRRRRSYLERLRSDNLARFEKLSEEIAVIQSALDRMVSLLQDAVSESSDPSENEWK